MRLIPPVSIKQSLDDVAPGELLRFRHGGESRFALVGVHNDKVHPPEKCLITFTAANDGRTEPCYVFPRWGRTAYLSYGTAYFFEFDQSEEAIDFQPFQKEDPNGVLLLSGERLFLEARAMSYTQTFGTAYFDIDSHEVVDRPRDSLVVGFRRWGLYLGTPEQHQTGDQPVIRFDAVRQA